MTVDAFNSARFSYNGCGLGQDLAQLRQVQVEGLSFLTWPGSDSPLTFDLSCIAHWRELSGLYFDLRQPTDFVVPPEQWDTVQRLSHLSLHGAFRPGLLDFTDRCANLIQLTADCAVFDLMASWPRHPACAWWAAPKTGAASRWAPCASCSVCMSTAARSGNCQHRCSTQTWPTNSRT